MFLIRNLEFLNLRQPEGTNPPVAKTTGQYVARFILAIFACGSIAFAVGFGFVWGSRLAQVWGPKHASEQSANGNFIPMAICYYAHPMETYGTPREAQDIQILESLGFYVVNPNLPEYKTKDMAFFCALAGRADVVAFRSLPTGKISPGVASEIKHAKRVIELPDNINERSL